MEKVFEADSRSLISHIILSDDEASTLVRAIDHFLLLSRLDVSRSDVSTTEYLEGYEQAQDVAKSVEAGIRVLTTDAEFYLAGLSLSYFVKGFNNSVRLGVMSLIATELSISADEFAEQAAQAAMMITQVPEVVPQQDWL